MTLAHPAWLLGLLLLPLIRWLHRGGRHRRELPVSRLALWQGAAASTPEAGQRQPPDPAWRRRALLAALLLIALAGPERADPGQRVTLWLDDSPSLSTREAEGTRLSLALAQARRLLAAMPAGEVELRALSQPWQVLPPADNAMQATLLSRSGSALPAPPPAALLRADREHWLLTDGVHPALQSWPGGRRADRVIAVGEVARNVGLERIAARRSLDVAGQLDVLLQLGNGGSAAETRTVVLLGEAGELSRSTQTLAPGATLQLNLRSPAATRLRARLEPGDALAVDDEIELDLAPLRQRRVAVDPGCPTALRAAVEAHPGLVRVAAAAPDVQAVLDCGTAPARAGLPTLRVRAERLPQPLSGAPRWSSAIEASSRIALDAQPLRTSARLTLQSGDTLLLAVGDEAVLLQRSGTPLVVETSLDLASLAAARGPELPLLVNLVFERLFGTGLIDATASHDRGAGAARVMPAAAASAVAAAAPREGERTRAPRDATSPLLLLAVLALLWELIALVRQWQRLRPVAAAVES